MFSFFTTHSAEFKAYKDVKPVKSFKALSQYKPPGEETSLETSYSATYKGEQVKAQPNDNKLLERRRIRSLYSEPSKEHTKVSTHTCRHRAQVTPGQPSEMLVHLDSVFPYVSCTMSPYNFGKDIGIT